MKYRFTLFCVALLGLGLTWRWAVAQQFGILRAAEKTVQVDGRERSYLVFAPRRSTGKLPLVFVLHGGGGNGRQMERHSGFNALARREGFLVCYPQGYEKNWNDGRGVEFLPAHQKNIDDVKFLRQVVDEIAKEHEVDRSRVFATGISNGAFMSHRLAAEASDVFCAVAPLAGGMAVPIAQDFQPTHPVSLFVIQGDSDPLVPFAGGEVGAKRGRKRGKFIATADAVGKYLAANGVKQKPTSTQLEDTDPKDGTTTEATIYPPGENGAKVQLYIVKNGGHTWPGTRPYAPERLIGKVSQDFNASEEIWKFFNSCPPRTAD